jgi:preprotein translocase subunit YajC
MQFDNQTTRNVADIVARILAGESAQQEPKMLEEELVGNQHKIDANKNNKIDAHDFKLLRKKKKVEEETELTESHFKVGDEVICKASGMEGEVVKIDEPQTGKYYTVKQENGKMVKYAPNELKKEEEDEDEEDDEDENKMKSEEVDNKKKDDTPSTSNSVKKPVRNSDGTIQSPISRARELAQQGLKKAMSKEEVEELDEAMFPGTKEYEKKYGQSPQQKLRKKGDTVPTSQGDMTKTDKGIAHRRRFTEMLESYTEGGLKYIASLVQEEPDNEEFTKEVEEVKRKATQKKSPEDEARVAKASVQAVKNEEVEELDELSKSTLASYAKKASHEARMKHGIGKDFERISKSSRKPEYKQGAKEWEDKYKSDARRREAGVGKAIDRLAKEEVEELDEAMTRKHFQQVADVIKSHPDQEKRNELAKHHAGIFKASNPRFDHSRFYQAAGANIKEEVEELDELSNKTLTDYETRARFSSDPKHREGAQQARKKVSGMSDRLRQGKLNNPMMKSKPSMSKEETEIQVINADIANGVDQVDIEERSLSEPEMKKKEEIVMSMKKKMPGFKERYGDRAKEVMYATATKMAKKD